VLRIKSNNKKGLTLHYTGRENDLVLAILADAKEREFIRDNIEDIEYDVTNQAFRVRRGPNERTTLRRAMILAEGKNKKLPRYLTRRENKFDFKPYTLV